LSGIATVAPPQTQDNSTDYASLSTGDVADLPDPGTSLGIGLPLDDAESNIVVPDTIADLPAPSVSAEPTERPTMSAVDDVVTSLAAVVDEATLSLITTSDAPLCQQLGQAQPDALVVSTELSSLSDSVLPTDVEGPPGSGGQTLAPPVISQFVADELDGLWRITGRVTDDKSVAGLRVDFGGLLAGEHAIVNAEGFFSITVPFAPGTWGAVTAVTTDSDGLESNQPIVWIQA
jgi:hypothetical protein